MAKVGEKPVRIADGDYGDTPIWSPMAANWPLFRTSKGRSQLCVWTAATGKVRELGESFPKDDSLVGRLRARAEWNPNGDAIVLRPGSRRRRRPIPNQHWSQGTDR